MGWGWEVKGLGEHRGQERENVKIGRKDAHAGAGGIRERMGLPSSITSGIRFDGNAGG